MTWDTTDVLSCVGANASIQLDTGAGLANVDVQRAQVVISNELRPDGMVIGSMFQPDFTMTDLILGVTLDVVISDAALYQKVYYGAATTGAMVDDILVGQFSVKAASAGVIGATTTPYSLELKSAGSNLEFMMLPIALRGQDAVVAQLQAQIKLLSAGGGTFTSYQAVLINDMVAY
jgi:hypothetical protein